MFVITAPVLKVLHVQYEDWGRFHAGIAQKVTMEMALFAKVRFFLSYLFLFPILFTVFLKLVLTFHVLSITYSRASIIFHLIPFSSLSLFINSLLIFFSGY